MSHIQRMFCYIKRNGSICVSDNGRAHIYVASDVGSSTRAKRIADNLRKINGLEYEVVNACGASTTFISETPSKEERAAERKKKLERLQFRAATAPDAVDESVSIAKVQKLAKRAKLLAALNGGK